MNRQIVTAFVAILAAAAVFLLAVKFHNISPSEQFIVDVLIAILALLAETVFAIKLIGDYVFRSAPKLIQNMPDFTHLVNEMGRAVVQIMNHSNEIMAAENDPLKDTATMLANELRGSLQQLSAGRIVFDLASNSHIREMSAVSFCKKRYRAVSIADSKAFWESSEGVDLMETNRQAKERGIKIERIFVRPEESVRDLYPIIEKQHKMGILVTFIPSNRIPRAYRARDFGIVDDQKVGVEVDVTGDRTFQRTTFYFADERFVGPTETIGEFDRIWNHLIQHSEAESFEVLSARLEGSAPSVAGLTE